MRQSDGRVHFSDLKSMHDSPAHYRYQVEVGRDDTQSLSVGRLVHALALGQESTVHAYPGPVRRGKAYEEWRAGLPADAEECTRSDLDLAARIVEGLMSDPLARECLLLEHLEADLQWDWCGLPCAGRMDAWGGGLLSELKTVGRSQPGPGSFRWEVLRYSYHAQMAWYRTALRMCGHEIDRCVIVAISTSPPHIPAVYELTAHEILTGEKMCRIWMEQLAQCVDDDHWPGYSEAPMGLGLFPDEGDA